MSTSLTVHRGAAKPLTFTTTGSFSGMDVEFRIGKRVSRRDIEWAATCELVVAEGGLSATGDLLIEDEDVVAGDYESQLFIINSEDETDFEILDGPPVIFKEAIPAV